MAAENILFPRRWYRGTISTNLKVIWEMSDNLLRDSYRDANAYLRTGYEQFPRLAGISFAFNAILLAAVSFLISKEVPDGFKDLICPLVISFGVFGAVYNFGALTFFLKSVKGMKRLSDSVKNFEKENNILDVQKCFEPRHLPSLTLQTGIFFSLFIVFWFVLPSFLC